MWSIQIARRKSDIASSNVIVKIENSKDGQRQIEREKVLQICNTNTNVNWKGKGEYRTSIVNCFMMNITQSNNSESK